MVDTMLSCDLLQASLDSAIGTILVVSDDTDFIPPLVAAAGICKGTVAVVAPNGTLGQSMQTLLNAKGISLFDLEDQSGTE
ncbi:hypothetical protein [Mumia sp. Pv 4-285]|uniref:hypothetical protein n=1 Tax=Mumia qirimensis TaxID=3234852 RepID=UPI00351D2963